MASLNRVQLIGNIGKDVELKTFSNSGDKVGKTSIAVTERFKKADGSKGEKTTWVNLDFPSHLLEHAQKLVTKGRQVLVEGKLEIRDYEQDGAKKTYVGVRVEDYQLLDKPKGAGVEEHEGAEVGAGA